jgi:hypothetical protein
MFTKEELKSLSVLLQRVDLKGNEAITVAILQTKIENLMNPPSTLPESPEPKVEEEIKTNEE